PNVPFTADENSGGLAHLAGDGYTTCGQDANIFDIVGCYPFATGIMGGSRIHVWCANAYGSGTSPGWHFPDLNWGDTNFSTLVVMPYNAVPVHQPFPTSVEGLGVILFDAGAPAHIEQLADSSGHTLLTGGGSQLNLDPSSRLPNAAALPVM